MHVGVSMPWLFFRPAAPLFRSMPQYLCCASVSPGSSRWRALVDLWYRFMARRFSPPRCFTIVVDPLFRRPRRARVRESGSDRVYTLCEYRQMLDGPPMLKSCRRQRPLATLSPSAVVAARTPPPPRFSSRLPPVISTALTQHNHTKLWSMYRMPSVPFDDVRGNHGCENEIPIFGLLGRT